MADDIVERLRALSEEWWECCNDIHVPLTQAADEIERLRAAGDGLVAAISNCGCVPSERCGWCIAKDKWQEARRG